MIYRSRNVLFIVVLLAAALLVLASSAALLPPAPIAPTPTWPKAIELPNKLERIRQP
jgi:hypothetical protein